ncbi:MAG: pitrilysin family protein [Calditrichia bacterium]
MRKFLILISMFLIGGTFIFTSCQKSTGEKMVLYPVQEDPTISIRIMFEVGSQNDPVGKDGLAAFTAAMLTEGATQKLSYENILEKLYPMAASINNQVDKELTVIYGRVYKDHIQDYYDLFRQVILEPGFTEEDFNRVKSSMLNYVENNLRYANDEELGKKALQEFIFEGTPYGHIVEGHVSSLKAITLDDVKAFYKNYYTRDNVIIGLGGSYDSGFVTRVKSDMKTLPSGKNLQQPGKPQVKPINGLEVRIIEKPGANATAISFGYPIDVLRGQRGFYALAVANSWFGEHRNSSSHLYQVIREARGLNYGDYSYIEYFPQGGSRQFPPPNVARHQQIFEVWIRPVPNDAKLFAFRAADRELHKLVDNGLTDSEFKLTSNFLKNYVLHFAPTTMSQLGYAMDDQFYNIDGSYLKIFRQKMTDLSKAEVNEAIKKYLQYKDMKIVFVTDNAEKLKEMLENDTPSPIKYSTPKPEYEKLD